MLEGKLKGNDLSQSLDDVCPHIWIGTFINGQPGCGMGVEKKAYAVCDSCFCHLLLHLAGDINEVHMLVCGDTEFPTVHDRLHLVLQLPVTIAVTTCCCIGSFHFSINDGLNFSLTTGLVGGWV